MDVVSLSPLRVGSVLWQPRAGVYRLTVVVKATFDLLPGESQLAETQEDLNEYDNHWNDDPERSVQAPSDLGPFKMRADVLLVGHAFAPPGEQVRSLVARLAVAEMDKRIEVIGPRVSRDGVSEEPASFSRMPLRYERAQGGPDTMNPVGIGPGTPADASGAVALPNIFAPGSSDLRAGNFHDPAGFGPIAPSWPLRRAQLGRHAETWDRAGWNRAPLPEDIELGYFNAAPSDQQIEAIRDGEGLVLEHLHPKHPKLVTRLAAAHPRAFVERPSRGPEELLLRGDTMWIDTDRAICTIVWRGQVALESPKEAGQVLVALEDARQRVTWPDVERMASRARAQGKLAPLAPAPVAPPQAEGRDPNVPLPRPAEDAERVSGVTKLGLGIASRFAALPVPPMAPGGGALSVRKKPLTGAPPPLPEAAAKPARPDVGPPPRVPTFVDEPNLPTMEVSAARAPNLAALAAALPFQPARPSADGGGPRDARARHTPPPAAIPAPKSSEGEPIPLVRARFDDATSTEEPKGLVHAMPAWLAQEAPVAPALVGAVPAVAAAPPAPAIVTPESSSPEPVPVTSGPATEITPRRAVESISTLASGIEPLSAASVAKTPRLPGGKPIASGEPPTATRPLAKTQETRIEAPPATRTMTAELFELLHVDETAAMKLRNAPGFGPLLDALDDAGDDATAEAGGHGRRHVYAVLARGTPADVGTIGDALARGVAKDGTFSPPVLLIGAELELGFGEVDLLRATLSALGPLLPREPTGQPERALVDAMAAAEAWLDRQGDSAARSVAEALTTRIRDAVGRGSRLVPAGYLEGHVERIALDRRAYQTRAVLGAPWFRAAFTNPSASASVPAYIPVAAGPRLPLFRRFSVRALVEVHPRQDQFETHPACARVLALARRLPPLASTPEV